MSTVINLKFYDQKWYVFMMDKHNKALVLNQKERWEKLYNESMYYVLLSRYYSSRSSTTTKIERGCTMYESFTKKEKESEEEVI